MKRIICIILAVLFLTIPVYGESDQEDLGLYAQSAVLIDGDSGRVLYSRASDQFRPMASTTKIMTCILALEYGNPEDVVTASSYAASQPKVHLGVRSGQQFYLNDLLCSLMLESHNDSAVMIVAQRISTIVDADQIIVLDNGEIAGKGTHRELLADCPVYRQIAMSQLSEEESA